tara:strand:+ start:38 stop:238 length:201 start_codon:yes stop_codon:yes gene_type:complete
MKTFLLPKNYVKELALEKIDELKFKIQEIKQKTEYEKLCVRCNKPFKVGVFEVGIEPSYCRRENCR